MKIKETVNMVEEKANESLSDLYEEYTRCVKLKSEAEKRCKAIKAKISGMFKEQDALGNYWLDTGNGVFKKEIRRSTSIDPIMADPILKRLGVFDKVVTYEPVYDLNIINELLSEGSIDEGDVKNMFKTEVSYAIKAEKERKKVQSGEEGNN